MSRKKIFISHSSQDIKLVESFVNQVLKLGLGIPADRIFCSSMEGHGVQSGQYIPDRLKEEINQACIALLFISKNYKQSEVCLNEIGASWVVLDKSRVIPLLLPGVDFDALGFLDVNRLGLKLQKKEDIIKLIQENKDVLNKDYNLELVHRHIDEFLDTLPKAIASDINENQLDPRTLRFQQCFHQHLYPFSDVLRRTIPAHADGIHRISDPSIRDNILTELSSKDFLDTLWYKFSDGDAYVEHLKQLPSGNWVFSPFNWEVNVVDMWVSMNAMIQNDFILIESDAMPPYQIQSDVGGKDYQCGILKDGTIISENERINGYAVINGRTITVPRDEVEPWSREQESHWIFFASSYHKVGYNDNEVLDFCEKMDQGDFELNSKELRSFLRSLENHPTVLENL